LTVSITSPGNNSTFSPDSIVNINADAVAVGGSVTGVEFYAGSNLIGTSTLKPYTTAWKNMAAGTYLLTAKAQNSSGSTVTSNAIKVRISRALKSVRSNKTSATQLIDSSSPSMSDNAQTTSELDLLVSDLEQTYNDFVAERSLFDSSEQIERYLFAALFLARSSSGLAREEKSASGVVDRVNKVAAYLNFCEDLMVSNMISQQSLNTATQVNARATLLITMTSATPSSTTGFTVSPNGGAKVLTTSTTPFGSKTASAPAGAPQYELGNLTVTVNGQAAALLSVSPTQINFTMPSDTPGGLAEILVTSREGNITHGTAAVTGLNPTIFGQTGDGSGRGAILDAVGFQSGVLGVTGDSPFQFDSRTRLTILTSGISTGVANTNGANDVLLPTGQIIANLAESVAVEARASDGRVFFLPVEFAGAQGTLLGLDQVNVALVPELRGAGSVQLTIVVNGIRSNSLRAVVQ
jgi:uncharacterized protein (TIGR03437 family)